MSMGPPEKMPLKSDPLTRPVSVSIKTINDTTSITSSGLIRKFSASPLPSSSSKTSLSSGSSKINPKHSPHHTFSSGSSFGSSSTKHQSLPNPKTSQYGTSSPKHLSSNSGSSSTGKPSMSALKSAAISPISKSSLTASSPTLERKNVSGSSTSSKDRDRDRALKYSSSSHGLKIKTASVKIKQTDIDCSPSDLLIDSQGTGQDSIKLITTKNRKGSLSAVIDKLKSAASTVSPPSTPTLINPLISDLIITPCTSTTILGKEKPSLSISSTLSSGSATSAMLTTAMKNSNEYILKHSSDGMKITINKTRTKDTSPSSKYGHTSTSGSSSGSNSPKPHTGLKPGVNSGPGK